MAWTLTQLDDLKEFLKLLRDCGADINVNALERAYAAYKAAHGL